MDFYNAEKIEMQKLVRLLTIVIVEWYHSVTWLLNAIHPSSGPMLLPKN
jgi:hypothetical protein